MPMLTVSVDYRCPTLSQLFPYHETCSSCFRYCKAHWSELIRFDSGLTQMLFCLACTGMFSVVGSTGTNQSYIQSYQSRAAELSVPDGCLLWGIRVIVPEKAREAVISLLHEAHPGISRTKRLARGYVWCPRMDKTLKFAVKTCAECQENQKSPARAPMHPWEWPDRLGPEST